ncbi:GumC family protein [Sporomusa sphaeroides]|uniref:GumC family protein n=1 Tax=Sporomusa sphaeroides TaxID=47679 RepID=UPI002BE55F74|nr:GumC family protein [Sporomusa sphaeroides]HML34161.1 GumC family protein [Sporomusa sphaeroides]
MEETTLDLKDIIKTLKKRRKLIAGVLLAFVSLAAVISFIIPPTFEGETTLRIKQPKGLADSLLGDLPTGNPMGTKQLMSTYAEILKSRTVVQELIDRTQSDKEKPPGYEGMLKQITTRPVKDTELLNVTVQADSPEEAQVITNTLVEIFIDRLTSLVRAQQATVKDFIGQRLKESRAELEAAEVALEKYKQAQRIVNPSEEGKALLDKLATIDKLAAGNQVALAASQAKLASARQQLGNEKIGAIADNALIQQYKGKLADLEVQLVSLLKNYTGKHPQVIAVQAAVNETQAKLEAELSRVASEDAASTNPIHQSLLQTSIQAQAEIAVAIAQQQAISQVLTESSQEIVRLPAKEQGLVKVARDANVAQEIYIMLAKRYEEARISEAMEPTDVQIIDKAIAPEKPVKPRILLNIVIAAILGLFTGTAAAFLAEYINKTVRTAEDVKQYLDLPVLGSIPDFDSNTERNSGDTWRARLTKLVKAKASERV